MRDNLPNMLKAAAKEWRKENKVVATGATRYDVALEEAADAIEELLPFKKQVEKGMGLLDKADELLNAIKPRWIPVTERLPEKSGWYLANVFSLGVRWGEITTKDSEWIQLVFYHEGKFHKLTGSNAKVTHWMPLPTPPKEE